VRHILPGSKGSISEALDKYLALIEEPREADAKYHPSSFWLCGRAVILAIRGTKVAEPNTVEDLRVFRMGHIIHQLAQEAVAYMDGANDLPCYNEFRVDIPEWNITGHGDTLRAVGGPNDQFEVVEYKSTKSLRYTPKEDHLKQASIYAVGAHDFGVNVGDETSGDIIIPPLGDRLTGVRLVYVNKIDMKIEEYFYPYSPAWRKAIEARVKELDHFRQVDGLDELPAVLPLDKGKPSWYLSYCPYRGSGLCCADNQEENGGF
jgi:hypothetical protein